MISYTDKDVFSQIASNEDKGVKFIQNQYLAPYETLGLKVEICKSRIEEALTFWKKDLIRLKKEINITKDEHNYTEPSHFKQGGHLCYWLRRMSPIISVYPSQSHLQMHGEEYFSEFLKEGNGGVATPRSMLLLAYKNEFAPFNLFLEVCRQYEMKRHNKIIDIAMDENYFMIVSQFLKEKNVSPHAIMLIYKSLFLGR